MTSGPSAAGTSPRQARPSLLQHVLSILFWSIISAAFIGPGTVTTAAAAGASHGYALLWALLFSTLATLALQEAAARLTVISGLDLGEALRRGSGSGAGRWLVPLLAGGAVVLGCAAYEAGNILGGVAGARLAVDLPPQLLTVACGLAAGLLLWWGTPGVVARLLSVAVAVMGAAFLVTAWRLAPAPAALLAGSFLPRVPGGGELLVLGLLGTTVVPYNLFLGSGLARGAELPLVRFGLTVAVLLGGVISMGILVVGAAVSGEMSFAAVAAVLAARLGPWAAALFAWGLFAAGLSSAITAPLAAALTVRGLLAAGAADEDPRWRPRSWRFRGVWLGVLAVGLGFGLSGVRPIPIIILAQALNGFLLPLAALFLLAAVNDRRLMGERVNGPASNAFMALVVAVTVLLGLLQLARAAQGVGAPLPSGGALVAAAAALTAVGAWPVARWVRRRRRHPAPAAD
ncbi:MAG TPA: divalent metal cation transporter [Thermoanaerobaculia bacterium]|nr:divalent metal cation transporter [Thermoanaerobaculia bacterium]